ncbi:MAG TPA: hypothetical protein VHE35_10285 [Kofleriaceae bacterium]|nr:hypothetical protein [Kofleriaceae bacterium]
MDPRGKAPVSIELNPTLAELLVRICVDEGTDDYAGVLSKALGMYDLARRARRQGERLCFVNARGEAAEVVI